MHIGISWAEPTTMSQGARLVEDLGFDVVAVGEHLFHHRAAPNPFVQLAAAAAATDRVRLLSSVNLVPLYPAALVAKLAATLDLVSRGRFDLGVGAGGEHPPEFVAVGVDPATRFRRLDEALEVLELLFSGDRVSYDGEFTTLDDVALDPPPVQAGGPPIWLGGRKPLAIQRAGRFARAWMPYMVTPTMLAESLTAVREVAVENGRAAEEVRGAVFAFACVDDDDAWARRTGIADVSAGYEQDFEPLADRYLLLGHPETVAERLIAFRKAGAETIVLHIAAPPEDRQRVLTTIAEQVVPTVRAGDPLPTADAVHDPR